MTFEALRNWLEPRLIDNFEPNWEQLNEFVRDLYVQSALFNLTAVPVEDCESRHLIDSLLCVDLIPEGVSVIDIGTGAGFPAWPLAWARHDLRVVAMDSTAKRLRFIERHPLPNLSTMLARAEEKEGSSTFDVVTGRALAPLGTQLEVSARWVKLGGLLIPYRTGTEAEAVKQLNVEGLGLTLEGIEAIHHPTLGSERLFPMYRKIGETDPRYPRKWAEIKARPIT